MKPPTTAPSLPFMAQRLWDRLQLSQADGCWLWQGTRHRLGYGVIKVAQEHWLVHRYVWELLHGPIRRGHRLIRSGVPCAGRICANPSHRRLVGPEDFGEFLGTCSPRGSQHYAAKLTEQTVRTIRTSKKPRAVLVRDLGVSGRVIDDVLAYRTWLHVE